MFLTSVSAGDVIIIVTIIVVLLMVGLFFLNRWASKKMGDQQAMIEKSKQQMTIYTIDKKHDKAANVNLPKAIMENLPKTAKFMKMYFVKAKIGPQIMTLMCEKKVYNHIQLKKNVKVEMAGIYIVSIVGMKTEAEMKAIAKEKKMKEKAAKKLEKDNKKKK